MDSELARQLLTDGTYRSTIFKKLHEDTNLALKYIHRKRREYHGEPVNWADLHCCQVALVVPDDGQPFLQTTIEEASPDATGFAEAIQIKLEIMGWQNVAVITEW